jgi:hypothetical protein
MALQNRVTPSGEIIADPARGTVMGNRGCLHDAGDQILRPYQVTRWIICKIDFNGRTRKPMPPGEYTSLFFLDKATALAAGHRPCYQCNWEQANAFADHWMAANPLRGVAEPASAHRVDHIDAQLHRERITDAYYLGDRRKRVYLDRIDSLPDRTFIALGPELTPFLVYGERLFPWTPQGYSAPIERPTGSTVVVLTPSSTVRALAHGYTPCLHLSLKEESAAEPGCV